MPLSVGRSLAMEARPGIKPGSSAHLLSTERYVVPCYGPCAGQLSESCGEHHKMFVPINPARRCGTRTFRNGMSGALLRSRSCFAHAVGECEQRRMRTINGMIGHAAERVHRVHRRRDDCTLKEHEVVVSHWPDVEAIRKRLPHRSKKTVQKFAGKCNLTTPRHTWTAAEDAKLRKVAAQGMTRREIASELGMSHNSVFGRLSYTRTPIARKPPKPSFNPLATAIRQRAFDPHMTLADLDRSLGDQKVFRQAAGRQFVRHIHIERAVKALGGRLAVEWIDE